MYIVHKKYNLARLDGAPFYNRVLTQSCRTFLHILPLLSNCIYSLATPLEKCRLWVRGVRKVPA